MGNTPQTNSPSQPETPKLISVTLEQLQAMIRDGVVAVTKQLQEEAASETTRLGQLDMDKLGNVIGDSVAKGMAKIQRPRVTVGQFIRRPYSAYHTDGVGDHERPKLNKLVFVNGAQIREGTTTDEEIRLLNQLTHSGRYCERMVEVIERQDTSEPVFELRFSNKIEQYMPLKALCKDLEGVLRMIVDQQLVESEDKILQDEERRARRQEAVERAREKRSGSAKVVLASR